MEAVMGDSAGMRLITKYNLLHHVSYNTFFFFPETRSYYVAVAGPELTV